MRYIQLLNGSTPIFSQFGSDIYASDVVQQALKCIVDEMMKLRPIHVRTNDIDLSPVEKSTIQRVLRKPNPLMTMSDFISKVMWNREMNYNSFIYKMYDSDGRLKGLYPLQPTRVDFLESPTGKIHVTLAFANGTETTMPYRLLIHIRKNYSVNDFMGGNEFGQPDHGALLKTLELNHTLLEGISKGMKSSFAINGVVNYNTMVGADKIEENLKKFEAQLNKSESGILGLDLKASYTPISREIQLVDEATLKFIDEKILRNFGVPLPILIGDYTKDQYEAFYQKTLEPIIINLSEVFTDGLFSETERDHGNEIQFFTSELVFMTMDQKLDMVRLVGDSGSMYENEKRKTFGMVPLPELSGVRMQSLNYVNVNIADKYQVGQPSGDGGE